MNPTNEQIAWLAGLLEGEGTFYIDPKGKPTIQMKMTDQDVLLRVAEWFGGNVRGPYDLHKPDHHKPIWAWSVGAQRDVYRLAKLVRPWMMSRRAEKIDEIIAFLDAKPRLATGSGHQPGQRHSEETKRKISQTHQRRRLEVQTGPWKCAGLYCISPPGCVCRLAG